VPKGMVADIYIYIYIYIDVLRTAADPLKLF
jgi:hypothetical protein